MTDQEKISATTWMARLLMFATFIIMALDPITTQRWHVAFDLFFLTTMLKISNFCYCRQEERRQLAENKLRRFFY